MNVCVHTLKENPEVGTLNAKITSPLSGYGTIKAG
jgi:hypothetical protein